MFHKYFKITKRRCLFFCILLLAFFSVQFFLTGSLVSLQHITTQAGNHNSSVIGVLDNTEVIRQKFCFDRKVLLDSFSVSFGSFQKKDVGSILHIQMLDGNNDVVYETDIPVENIRANADYMVSMEHPVSIPRGVSCCIRMTCSSDTATYDTIPTVNTTNRTNPNTYMSTLKMQTRAKSINISYSYSYRQLYPLIVFCLEILLLFVLVFERMTEYAAVYHKKRQKEERKAAKEEKYEKEKMAQRREQAKERRPKDSKEDRPSGSRIKTAFRKKKEQKKKRQKRYKTTSRYSVRNLMKWILTDQKVRTAVRVSVIVFNPLVLAFLLETMNGTAGTIYPNVWLFTWILLGGLQLLLLALIGNSGVAMLIMNIILFPAGLANLFLMNVRGTPFLPADILGMATGMEVASTYTFSLTPAQFVMIPAFAIWCIVIMRTCGRGSGRRPALSVERLQDSDRHSKVGRGAFWKKFRLHVSRRALMKRLLRCAALFASGACIILCLYRTNILENCGIKDNVWNKVSSCRANGFYMNYFINFHYLKVSAPSGYSHERVADILEEVEGQELAAGTSPSTSSAVTAQGGGKILGNSDFAPNTSLHGKKPNIILIMNESLADFDLVGNMEFNRDPLPFIHSMKENTIKGRDYVSVFGAGTSNSEFEAMTGNTMAYFPSGSNVYQQFMHKSTFSMPSYLKELGYVCNAVHPSSGANWNRVATYQSMKFDRFVTIEDFKKPEYVRYISDKESYKKVIELYEKKGDQPMFVFDMTIQNHGGYLTNTNWKNPVYVKDSYYDEAKEYLSATYVSDQAFQYLIDYFSKEEEPTLICMFGDHFPSIETDFYEELLGKPQSDWELEDIQKRYAAPFVLWANYDIEEGENVDLSNNYLENLMLKQAGIELPLYHQYLERVSQEIPVMNVNGYMNREGVWNNYGKGETDIISKLLTDYEILQYGYYSDTDKDKMSELFQMKQ